MFVLEESYRDILNNLKNAKQNDKIAHAYLFSSNKDKNLKNIVKYFMMLFYCKHINENGDPCYECEDCQKIIKNSHINFYEVDSNGSSIKKEQIENLQAEFAKTSLEEGIRVYLINNCEKMTNSSANSLLKFLEEPQSNTTYAFLITENINECLPTIISRCQIIKFKNKTKNEIYEKLINETNVTMASLLSNYCNTEVEALELLHDDTFVSTVEFIKTLMRLINTNSKDLYTYYRDNVSIVFINKENVRHFFQLLLFYFLDLYKLTRGFTDLVYKEEIEILNGLIKSYGNKKISNMIDYLQNIIKKIYFNVNETIILDELILKLK